MHKLSTGTMCAGLGLVLAGCGTANPPQDPRVSSLKGANLVFELVCMPVVLDGADFLTLANAHRMVAMAPATSGAAQGRTFRLGLTGVSATLWEDGSCAVGAEIGDSEQLQAQTLASLEKRGHAMKQGVSGRPASNDGVGAAYCSAGPQPLVLGVTMPASASSKAHALIATLYRAGNGPADLCLRS